MQESCMEIETIMRRGFVSRASVCLFRLKRGHVIDHIAEVVAQDNLIAAQLVHLVVQVAPAQALIVPADDGLSHSEGKY